MYKKKSFLAIIPARGGSKRLPRKNLLNLKNKPLITWSVEAALKSKYIDKVIVSSDDSEIINTALEAGATILLRPTELASDTSSLVSTINHVLKHTEHYDYIIVLQPTSPLRNENHIDEAIELLIQKNAHGIVSVCEEEHSPLWSNTIPADGSLKDFLLPEIINKQSQQLEPYFRLNGALYLCETQKFVEEQTLMLSNNIFAYKMNRKDSVDIDTEFDFLFADALLNYQCNSFSP